MPTIFSPKIDKIFWQVVVSLGLAGALWIGVAYYYFTPEYTRVGYAPEQPVPFSHKLHAGQLGMDCRYCHTNVEKSPHANVPATQTCMNCHLHIKKNSPLLAPVRESWKTGKSIRWKRIHKLPDYAYFNHAVHVNRGVSCVSCHGKINEMKVVYHAKPLSMGWCLDCHRNPEQYIRPVDQVTNLDWEPPEGQTQIEIGTQLKTKWKICPPDNCQGCHH
ncbi:MAG: cytochrome c3 family protein [Gemmataceae bacterium]